MGRLARELVGGGSSVTPPSLPGGLQGVLNEKVVQPFGGGLTILAYATEQARRGAWRVDRFTPLAVLAYRLDHSDPSVLDHYCARDDGELTQIINDVAYADKKVRGGTRARVASYVRLRIGANASRVGWLVPLSKNARTRDNK
jgi:hypothetical protein